MSKNAFCRFAVVLLGTLPGVASAQLIAVDDRFGVPVAQQLVVEEPGVLDNDTYDGDPAVDAGATAELVLGPSSGTLECGSDPGLELCPDGSFNYTPDPSFPGSETFVYRVSVGTEMAEATATLSACGGGPTVFMCWKKSEFLSKIADLGYHSFHEGFEDDLAWGAARSPSTAPSVVSQGIGWETNHRLPPAGNEITTGSGPARTGLWGVFDPDHGYATGTVIECDVDEPPDHCLYKDGVSGIRQPGESLIYAVGGYFTGAAMPQLVALLDDGPPIGLGGVPSGFQFYGVIDTQGFETFRFQEIDGKVGQSRYVFADDFFIGMPLSAIFSDGFEIGDTSAWSASAP